MRPSTYQPISTTTQTAADTTTNKTFTPAKGTSAFLITCEGAACRITLDGTDPSAGTGSHVVDSDSPALVIPVLCSATIKAVSTAAANSVINITWLS